jgi:serine/threonine protein kinase/class 3 adenylate cyclase
MNAGRSSAPALILRVSADDLVLYANAAMAEYVRAPKNELIGTPLEVLASRCSSELAEVFSRPEGGRAGNRLVADDSGRIFEAKTYMEGGVLDIILDEVTTQDMVLGGLKSATGLPMDSLSEDELRTVRQPERRYLTVSQTLLRDVGRLAERLTPVELRMIVDSFAEEAVEATIAAGCTISDAPGDSVLSIFGAPRNYTDHPLRAVRAACETMHRTAALHASMHLQGKEIPPCSIGIWTGDAVAGTLGAGPARCYTVVGMPVDLAARLAHLARPGEVLLPEHTLMHLLRVLPEGWSHLRAESETEPDLSDFQWGGEAVLPLPETLRKAVYLVGPGVEEDVSHAEFFFDYLWSMQIPGQDEPVPILRVSRPSAVGDGIELSADNILSSSPVQMLGKYRLMEVVGTGGMGRVWRGVDRFGNAVAIKVLHSHDTITDAQIKRFRREAEVMAKLPHRNICRVFEMNEFEGMQYIAMEYVHGLSLSDLLYANETPGTSGSRVPADLGTLIRSIRADLTRRESEQAADADAVAEEEVAAASRPKTTRVLPVPQTLSIVLRVCEAIQFAHEHGVLHRDLKPGNILLREDGEPLVADFGLAKLSSADATHSLSVSGHVVGTMENMPPEQAESSKDVDERADVYAIGTILFQMLTGHRHFEATGNIVADAQALKTHEPPRLRAYNPRIDPDLEIITLKALRNNPSHRYRSVSALKSDLERYRRGEVITAKPVSAIDLATKLYRRNKVAAVAILASAGLVIATTAAAVWSLTAQLEREKSARLEADAARKDAEGHKMVAEERRREAEENAREALALQRRAEALLQEKNKAEIAARMAHEASERLAAETETERALRLEAERNAQEKESLLASKDQQITDLELAARTEMETSPRMEPRRATTPDREQIYAARQAMGEALSIFNFELSPFELERNARQPEVIAARLNRAIELASSALLTDPGFSPGWVLKGRLHLGAMEFDRAADSFARASEGFESGRWERADDPRPLLEIASELADGGVDVMESGTGRLLASSNGLDHAAGHTLRFFSESGLIDPTSKNPLQRNRGPSEIALALLLDNAWTEPPLVSSGESPASLSEISFTGSAPDLSALEGLTVGSLTAGGVENMDWTSLTNAGLESLTLTDSPLTSLPADTRTFTRLRNISLRNTSISSLDFLRAAPQVQSLDLADTPPSDLSALFACRRLQFLDISGADRSGLRILINLPLESLTLSPHLISDRNSLETLRFHRTLRVFRSPEDPENFTPVAFWKKYDAGDYEP